MQAKLSDLKITLFDVETTGLEPEAGDRIVEIAALKAEGGRIIAKLQSLINPQVPVSKAAFAVNGITNQMLKDAPKPEEIIPQFMDFVKGDALFAYNAAFDAGFLRQELKLLGESLPPDWLIIDMLAMARALVPNLGGYKLNEVAKHFGVCNPQRHRALEDVEMAFEVLQRLFDIFIKQGVDDFTYLKNIFCIDKTLANKSVADRITEIQEAISLAARLKIKYFSLFRGELTEREVSPREIIREAGKDYLVGYCHLRKEERTFRIDGILHLEKA